MSPHGPGETAGTYAALHELFANRLAEVTTLFLQFPKVQATSIVITPSGRIDITAEGIHGVLKDWAHALPEHTPRPGFVATHYGSTEADVLEQGHIRVTVKRPLVGPGGVSA